MTPLWLNAVNYMLHNSFRHLVTQRWVFHEDVTQSLCFLELQKTEKIHVFLAYFTLSRHASRNLNKRWELLTPGERKRSRCLCSKDWFCWLPRQKFWRNSCASIIMSSIRKSSFCNKKRDIMHFLLSNLCVYFLGMLARLRIWRSKKKKKRRICLNI